MRKKLLGIIVAMCLIISTCALVACNKTSDPPEGGAWYAQAKVSGGTATLTFTSDTEWKLDCKGAFLSDSWNPWQSGTYKFDGKPGTSTLHMTATKESPNTFIKDKAVGEEATYEPTDGVYVIVFDVNGDDTTFNLKPPTDGTKPDGSSAPEGCTNHVDNNCDGVCDNEGCNEAVAINHVDANSDGKCDKCGNNMPAEKTVQVALTTDALGGGTINLYTNNTFDFNLTYGGKILEGTWTLAQTQTEITLTVDKTTILGGGTESPIGDTVTVTADATQYPYIEYTCSVNYDATSAGQGVIPMTFVGSIGQKPNTPPVCTNHVDNNCDGVCDNEGCNETVAINHVDANSDGKCDKCGNDMPEEKTVKYEVEAPVYTETMKATLKIYEDNTWEVFFSGDMWCNGTWSVNNDTHALTVVRTNTASGVTLAGAENETVVCQLESGAYTIMMNFPSKDGVVFTVNVSGSPECTDHVDSDGDGKCDKCGNDMPQGEVTVMQLLTATASSGQTAKIELKSDKSWTLSICYYTGGDFTPTANGTWALDNTTYNISLNVTGDAANVLSEETYTLMVDYTTQKYSGTIACEIPQVGNVSFDFATAEE